MEKTYNPNSLDTVCAALAYAMGIQSPAQAAPANSELTAYIDRVFDGKKADRVVMYNPDAIGQWIYEKYPHYFTDVKSRAGIEIPLATVMPSVTPVCFGTMYTGAQPAVHGITQYERKLITIDSFFDALIRAGKKPILMAAKGHSIGVIFDGKNMEYFRPKEMTQVNAKAIKLLLEDEYDVYIIYNGNYDSKVHKYGPEDPHTLGELRINAHMFAQIWETISENWKDHRTLLGFCPDHGCHLGGPGLEDDEVGGHGLDIPKDREILHYFTALEGTL